MLTSGRIWTILSISSLAIAGQYIKYPYIVVDLKSRLATGPLTTATLLLVYGCASILGTMSATWAVSRLGVRTTVSTFLGVILLGLILWSSQPASLSLAGLTLFIWGIGMSPAIAAQQARLIEADPVVASASTSMNTSVVYLGQAAGTLLGGEMLIKGTQHLGWGDGHFAARPGVVYLGAASPPASHLRSEPVSAPFQAKSRPRLPSHFH